MKRNRTVAALLLVALVAAAAGCDDVDDNDPAAGQVGGTPSKGRELIMRYGCTSCHTIPGIPGANGLVGPPLTSIGSRMYVGGVLRNTPDNIERWIQNPRAVDPKTAMPNVHVTAEDSKDIAAYLYTLR